jgi:hypothetical protein
MGKVSIREVALALLSCSGVSLSQGAQAEGEITETKVSEGMDGLGIARVAGNGEEPGAAEAITVETPIDAGTN